MFPAIGAEHISHGGGGLQCPSISAGSHLRAGASSPKHLGTRPFSTCNEARGSLLTFMLESSFTSLPRCWYSEVLTFAFVSQQYKQTECFFPLFLPKKVRIGSGRLHSQCGLRFRTLQGPDASCLAFHMNLLFAWPVQKRITVFCFYQKFLRTMSKPLFSLCRMLLLWYFAVLLWIGLFGVVCVFICFKNKHLSFLCRLSFACGWIEAAFQDWHKLG